MDKVTFSLANENIRNTQIKNGFCNNNNIQILWGFEAPSIQKESPKEILLKQLKTDFKNAKKEQGLIGKPYDALKCLFNTEYSSETIEKELNKLSLSSTQEEFDAMANKIEQYRKKQDLAVDAVATTSTAFITSTAGAKVGGLIGTALGSFVPGIGNVAGGVLGTILGFVGGILVGAVSNVCINQVENMTDGVRGNSWHNDNNIIDEISDGAALGLTSMLVSGLSKKVSSGVKTYMGSTKEGVVFAENGSANVMQTIKANAIAEGIGGAVGSTVITDGKYLLKCATNSEQEFNWEDFLTTTELSAVTGGVIGGVFGAFNGYSNSVNHNTNWVLENKNNTVIEKGGGKNKLMKKSMKFLLKRNSKFVFKKYYGSFIKNRHALAPVISEQKVSNKHQ